MIPWTVACQAIRSVIFFRQEYWSCPFLLQGIFPTQGWNPHLLNWKAYSLPLHNLRSQTGNMVSPLLPIMILHIKPLCTTEFGLYGLCAVYEAIISAPNSCLYTLLWSVTLASECDSGNNRSMFYLVFILHTLHSGQ